MPSLAKNSAFLELGEEPSTPERGYGFRRKP